MDLKSYSRWYDYSRARDAMFAATDSDWAPWYVADTNDKKRGRLNIISHLLSQVPYTPVKRRHVKLPERGPAGDYSPPELDVRHIPTPFWAARRSEFSKGYAEQNERDYKALQAAVKSGRIKVRTGLDGRRSGAPLARQRREHAGSGDGEVGGEHRDGDGRDLQRADLGREGAEQDQREGGGDERPGERGEHRREGESLRQARDEHMGGGSGGAADEQHHEERASHEAGGLAEREDEDLREHDRDQQARAERRPVVDHRGELVGPREQRQRQRDADEPERDPTERRAKDRVLGERSQELRHAPDRDGGDQRERAGDEAEGHGREQLPVLVAVRRQRVEPDERRPRDREVHREGDRGRQQTGDQRVGEP